MMSPTHSESPVRPAAPRRPRARRLRHLGLLALIALAASLAACGESKPQGAAPADRNTVAHGLRRGGTVQFLASEDVDSLDPGKTCSDFGYSVNLALNRTLYSYKPGSNTPVPDIAAGPPQISRDGRTVTIRMRPGIRFSPPVNREITSSDIKYAIERSFTAAVNNCVAGLYMGDIVGAPAAGGSFKTISGIQTPDAHTIVFNLTAPTSATLIGALGEATTAPIPPEYARRYDAQSPSTYSLHPVATGPYMVGEHRPGELLTLVRNPNWSASTDFRPAYADRWEISETNGDPTVAAQRALQGQATACCNSVIPDTTLHPMVQQSPSQVALGPPGATSFATLNDQHGPFKDINLRRAVYATLDRQSLLLAVGGADTAVVASGFTPPAMAGYQEAGGSNQGAGSDFAVHPSGDAAVAKSYMLKARADGVPVSAAGRYQGGKPIMVVGITGQPQANAAETMQATLRSLGFDVDLHLVPFNSYRSKFCELKGSTVDVCANNSIVADFPNPASSYPAYSAAGTVPVGDPAVTRLIQTAQHTPAAGGADLRAWAAADRAMIAQATHVPYAFVRNALVVSRDVAVSLNPFYVQNSIDFSYSGLR